MEWLGWMQLVFRDSTASSTGGGASTALAPLYSYLYIEL
jgi:hypothetical protein